MDALTIKPQINNCLHEEIKESEFYAWEESKYDQHFQSLFEFYNNLDNLNQNDYQFK